MLLRTPYLLRTVSPTIGIRQTLPTAEQGLPGRHSWSATIPRMLVVRAVAHTSIAPRSTLDRAEP